VLVATVVLVVVLDEVVVVKPIGSVQLVWTASEIERMAMAAGTAQRSVLTQVSLDA
jgi:hypothetical protein